MTRSRGIAFGSRGVLIHEVIAMSMERREEATRVTMRCWGN